jgi:hypothetical protein
VKGNDHNDELPLCCDRCAATLTPGEGTFYVVRIEAFADPTPPEFSVDDLMRDPEAEIRRIAEEMGNVSAQEAMDQIYRRVVLYLCGPCYRQWIENPTG